MKSSNCFSFITVLLIGLSLSSDVYAGLRFPNVRAHLRNQAGLLRNGLFPTDQGFHGTSMNRFLRVISTERIPPAPFDMDMTFHFGRRTAEDFSAALDMAMIQARSVAQRDKFFQILTGRPYLNYGEDLAFTADDLMAGYKTILLQGTGRGEPTKKLLRELNQSIRELKRYFPNQRWSKGDIRGAALAANNAEGLVFGINSKVTTQGSVSRGINVGGAYVYKGLSPATMYPTTGPHYTSITSVYAANDVELLRIQEILGIRGTGFKDY